MPPEPPVRRHADHDPAIVCRPALGASGLCEALEDMQRQRRSRRSAPSVANAQAADTAYRLAAVKVAVYEFLHQYGHSSLPSFQVALDLAVSLRKIIDGTEEGT